MKQILMVALTLCVGLGVAGCSNDSVTQPRDGFDRAAMLRGMTENYIVPEYEQALAAAESLDAAVQSFLDAPDEASLLRARTAWTEAFMQWQDVAMFDIGPAVGLYGDLSMNIATFPISETKVERYVESRDTLFQNFDRDSRGLLAMEYLLFFHDPYTIVRQVRETQDNGRRDYLIAVNRNVVNGLRAVVDAWKGSYSASFVARTGTDAGSATSDIVNAMAMSFEVIKNDKVGIPAGKRVGQSGPAPERVEAYYSYQSLASMRRHFDAIQAFWTGALPGTTGSATFPSIRSYLSSLEGGPRLIADTEVQFAAVRTAMTALDGSRFDEACAANDPRVDALHTELQKLTRFMKSELASILGVAITYSSGDGD